MANPDLVLLDEPSEGLAPMIVANLARVIEEISDKGMTILMGLPARVHTGKRPNGAYGHHGSHHG